MAAIYPIPTNRASDIMLTRRLMAQLSLDQRSLFAVQDQVSTGRAFTRPSQNPQASVRAMTLQRTIEYKEQYRINLSTSGSFLAASETSISSVLDQLRDVRGSVLAGINEPTTAQQREAIAEELRAALDYLVDTGNASFRGRYLFNGLATNQKPYEKSGKQVVFQGDEQRLSSIVDQALLFDTNISGHEVFGGFSEAVVSSVELNSGLTQETRLSQLRSGQGIALGTIRISDGLSHSDIDLRGASSVGDVIRLIRSRPPQGRALEAYIEGDHLRIDWADSRGGGIAITDLDGGTSASDLGIATPASAPPLSVTGSSLAPRLTSQTRLGDLLGQRASTYIRSLGENNDIYVEAVQNGVGDNGVSFNLVDDELLDAGPAVGKGGEFVEFDSNPRAAKAGLAFSGTQNNLQLTATTPGLDFNQVEIRVVSGGLMGDSATANYDPTERRFEIAVDSTGATTIQSVIDAVNAEGTFAAASDPSDPADGTFNPLTTVDPTDIDRLTTNTSQSGGQANTYYVFVNPRVSTAQDAVNALNSDTAFADRFTASLDSLDSYSGSNDGGGLLTFQSSFVTKSGTGEALDLNGGLLIQVAGTSYAIDVQGADTLEDLINRIHQSGAPVRADVDVDAGTLRVRSAASGVDFSVGENGGTTATQLGLRTLTAVTKLSELNYGRGVRVGDGTDFTIRRNDGVELAIDVSAAKDISDVLRLINDHPDNQDADRIEARLAITGNGIELADDNPPGDATLSIEAGFGSFAAQDLGLIPIGEKVGYPGGVPTPANLAVKFDSPNHLNNSFRIEAVQGGTELNGIDVILVDGSATGDTASVVFDELAATLTVTIDPNASTAKTVIDAINLEGTFRGELTTVNGVNDGSGLLPTLGSLGLTSGGSSQPAAQQATGVVRPTAPNNLNTSLRVSALRGGTQANGVEVIFADTLAGDVATASFDSTNRQLVVQLDASSTTASTIVGAIELEGTFAAALETELDPGNNGSGVVGLTGSVAVLKGGTPEILSGRDVNHKEVHSIFNSVQRMIDVFSTELDFREAERAFALFEQDFERITQALAEIGAKNRAVDVLATRLEDETINLRASLSLEVDVDLAEAISKLTFQQTAYQASLQMIGQSFQLTLLNFL